MFNEKKIAIHVKLMEGVGDQLYSRPFIKHISKSYDVYLECVLPELFSDICGVKFVNKKDKSYRTQQKQMNSDNSVIEYVDLPEDCVECSPYYLGEHLRKSSIVSYFCSEYGVPYHTKLEWDLPDLSRHLNTNLPENRKIAIIRPSTIRKEWHVTTRSPKPEYISWCAKVLKEYGYYVISIADLEDKHEWLENNVTPPADMYLHKGELGIYGTIELIKKADIVVGGSGFILPAAVCANTNLFLIFGGRMAFDSPYKLFHGSMDMSKVGWAVPDNPCRCDLQHHNCDKTITNLEWKFLEFLSKIV